MSAVCAPFIRLLRVHEVIARVSIELVDMQATNVALGADKVQCATAHSENALQLQALDRLCREYLIPRLLPWHPEKIGRAAGTPAAGFVCSGCQPSPPPFEVCAHVARARRSRTGVDL